MTYRVKVYGKSVTGPFGADVYEIASPADVKDLDGVLLITTVPFAGAPAVESDDGRVKRAARKPTRGSQVAYPRGGWTKSVVTDYIDEED